MASNTNYPKELWPGANKRAFDMIMGSYLDAYTDAIVYGQGVVRTDGEEFYSPSITEMLKDDDQE